VNVHIHSVRLHDLFSHAMLMPVGLVYIRVRWTSLTVKYRLHSTSVVYSKRLMGKVLKCTLYEQFVIINNYTRYNNIAYGTGTRHEEFWVTL